MSKEENMQKELQDASEELFELPKLLFSEHHLSHAASAFYPSPFQEAAILCMDGVGEWATTSAWIGKGNAIKPLWEISFPHSLGLLYSAFTYYCGFKVNSGEYKLMGLAPYGEPRYVDLIKKNLIDIKEDWKTKHWRAIGSAYNSSPFFEFYCDELKEVLFKEYSSLANLNKALLEHICNELGVTSNVITSETYINIKDSELDLRSTLNPKKTFKGSETYPRYIQIFEAKHGFQSNLSILDLLFHEGPESLNYLIKLINR